LFLKKSIDPNGFVNAGLLNTIIFKVNTNGNPNSVTLTGGGGSVAVCMTPGATISVSEDLSSLTQSGFQFTPSYSPECTSTAPAASQSITCTITNKVSSVSGSLTNSSQVNIQLPGISAPVNPTNKETITTSTPQNLLSPASTEPNAGNPPFQTCTTNVITLKTGATENTNTIQAPSSATYVVEGDLPLDKVRHAMDNLATNKFSIQILSDLQSTSNKNALALGAPLLAGNIIVQSDDEVKQKIIPFAINNARTECHYITLAKAIGPYPNANSAIAPIGGIHTPTNNLKVSDTNKLLIGANRVTTGDLVSGQPGQLNPPFATCQTPASSAQNLIPDDIALYNINGVSNSIDNHPEIFGHHLLVEVTVDLIPELKTDLAQIPNNNNPFVKVNLIADKNLNTGHIIPFTLENLNTDCKSIAKSDSPVFKPIIGEITP